MTLVAGLFGEVADSVIQRRLKLLLVLVWENLYTESRQQFIARLNGIEFDKTSLNIKTILSDWDRVMLSKLTDMDRKFAKDVQWKKKKHKYWKPSKADEPYVRAIYAAVREKDD